MYPESATLFLTSNRKSAKREEGSIIIRNCCESLISINYCSANDSVFEFEFIKALSGFECQLCSVHFDDGAKVTNHIKSPKHEAAYQKYLKEHIGYHEKIIRRKKDIIDLLDKNVGKEVCLSEKFEDASLPVGHLVNVYLKRNDPYFAHVVRTDNGAHRAECRDARGTISCNLSVRNSCSASTANEECEGSLTNVQNYLKKAKEIPKNIDNDSSNSVSKENETISPRSDNLVKMKKIRRSRRKQKQQETIADVEILHPDQNGNFCGRGEGQEVSSAVLEHEKNGSACSSINQNGNIYSEKDYPNIEKHMNDNVKSTAKSFPCTICKRKFAQQSSQRRHERSHIVKMRYKCEYCGKASADQSTHVKHVRIHTGEKPYVCETCGKAFCQPSSLITHRRIHTDERPFRCKLCGKCFRQKTDLNRHEMLHSGMRPYQCEDCGKRFNRQFVLNCHKRLHTGEKFHICKICGHEFTSKSNEIKHMRTHTGEKPFLCKFCEKRFARKDHLERHELCHTGKKPFECEDCGGRFRSKSNLSAHRKRHVKENQSLPCEKL